MAQKRCRFKGSYNRVEIIKFGWVHYSVRLYRGSREVGTYLVAGDTARKAARKRAADAVKAMRLLGCKVKLVNKARER